MDHPTNGAATPPPKRPRKRKPLDISQYPAEFTNLLELLCDPGILVSRRDFVCPNEKAAHSTVWAINRFLRACRERGEGEIRSRAEMVSRTYSFVPVGAFVEVRPKSDRREALAIATFVDTLLEEREQGGLHTVTRGGVRSAGTPETDPYAAIYRTAPQEPPAAISPPASSQEATRGPLTGASIYGEDYAPRPASVALVPLSPDPLAPYSQVRETYWAARTLTNDRLSARRDAFRMLVDTGHPVEAAAAIMDRIEREGPLEGKSPDER